MTQHIESSGPDREIQRLKRLGQLLNPLVAELGPRLGLSRNARIMDVGCGPFEAVDTLATLVIPSGQDS